jgi:phenylalanyl-tRNA synthetase beta chain
MPVTREDARRILAGLGFVERAADDAAGTFEVPSWRADCSTEEDLVEEIVRSRGFDAIPETLPHLAAETPAEPRDAVALARVRAALEGEGFSEAVSFSFVAPGELAAFDPAVRPVALANPITAELAVMRTSLVPSLLAALGRNRRQGVEDVRLYEIASTYEARRDEERDPPAVERRRIAAVLAGRRSPLGWAVPAAAVDFADAKAAVEAVLAALGVRGARFAHAPGAAWLHPRAAAAVALAGGGAVGLVGEIHPRLAAALELPRGVLALELDLEALAGAAVLMPAYAPIPRFPAVLRDLAVVVAEGVPAEAVLAAVRAEALVEDATLFDVYTGAPIPAGRKSLALAIRYRAADRTLTDQEADAAHARIVERLRGDPAVGAELRA